jgi:hypothetical protein
MFLCRLRQRRYVCYYIEVASFSSTNHLPRVVVGTTDTADAAVLSAQKAPRSLAEAKIRVPLYEKLSTNCRRNSVDPCEA